MERKTHEELPSRTPLEDVLKTVQVTNAANHRLSLTAPWGLSMSDGDRAGFLAVMEGRCLLEMAKAAGPVQLEAGDFIVVPRGERYVLRDAPGSPAVPIKELLHDCESGDPRAIHHGGGGAVVSLVVGCFEVVGEATNPLLEALPPMLRLCTEREGVDPWLKATLRFLGAETADGASGTQCVVARQVGVLFLQAVRDYALTLPGQRPDGSSQKGWLRALADPQIGRALLAIHEHPDRAWTVEDLATEAYMSRTAFAQRFTEVMGQPPFGYLTQWRMHLAGSALRQSDATLREVAGSVGYESPSAFSKAFKREVGQPPSTYRAQTPVN